jgi:8-oxo-dGTP pyrophosphatase MutT (NUDIX family)
MADYVGGPIARQKNGQVRYLVMWTWDVLPNGKLARESKLKFAGGMEHLADGGDLEETFRREIRQETGLIIRPDAPIEYLGFLKRGNHMKHFMRAWRRDCTGSLRKRTIRDGKTCLGWPFWADKRFLEENLHRDHRLILDKLPG